MRSFRSAKSEEVIRAGTSKASLKSIVEASDSAKNELQIVFEQKGDGSSTKQAFSQGKAYRTAVHYLHQRFAALPYRLHTITFNPTDHDLIRGEPGKRRSYIDRAVSAENSTYFKRIHDYQRILLHRNTLLKNETRDFESLRTFGEQLCILGSNIVFGRLQWLQRMSEKILLKAEKVAPHQEII